MYTLYLVRGLPGSGKSTLACMFRVASYCQFEADDYFMNKGEYKFDKDKLEFAHLHCFNRAYDSMGEGDGDVIVSNTFSRNWEMDKYKEAAEIHGYNVFVIECQNNFGSVHDVPESSIQAMRDRWEKNKD